MKTKCYPKYSYVSFIALSVIALVFSICPFIIKTNDDIVTKIIWSLIMLLFGVIFIIASIQYMQCYYIDGNDVVVKSAFGIIMKLNALNVEVCVESLPTYSSWVLSVDKKWICIYDKSLTNLGLSKFKSGCSNNKRFKRIQIIYTDENKKTIEQWIGQQL